jgi:hypothetical protein
MAEKNESEEAGAPVREGGVFAALLMDMMKLTRELEARRQFCEDVSTWLKERGDASAFEEWRVARTSRSAPAPAQNDPLPATPDSVSSDS